MELCAAVLILPADRWRIRIRGLAFAVAVLLVPAFPGSSGLAGAGDAWGHKMPAVSPTKKVAKIQKNVFMRSFWKWKVDQ